LETIVVERARFRDGRQDALAFFIDDVTPHTGAEPYYKRMTPVRLRAIFRTPEIISRHENAYGKSSRNNEHDSRGDVKRAQDETILEQSLIECMKSE